MAEHIIHCPSDPDYEPDPRGLGVVLFESIKSHGNRIAQIDADTGESQTYFELLLDSIRVAQHMQENGVKSEDIITICAPNIMESYVVFLATLFVGAKVASLDPTLSATDVEQLLKQVEPKIIFCGEESTKLIETVVQKIQLSSSIVVFGETTKHTTYNKFIAKTGSEKSFEPAHVNNLSETAVVFFSSGTTGLPKGICNTHYGLLSKFDSKNNSSNINGHNLSIFLYFTTVYWISAVAVLVLSSLRGSTRLLGQKFDAERTSQYIEKYKVSFMFLSPYLMNRWIKHKHSNAYDLSSLGTLLVGGGYISGGQIEALKKLTPNTMVLNTYGMTEAHGGVTGFNYAKDSALAEAKHDSVGRPMQGLTYKLVDVDTGEICGPNRPGEIRLKGKTLMSGYYKKPKESADAWDEEGYLRTGDIGYYDEDQCFYIIDRIKEMLRFQSWHITPAELETILLTHPDIQEAAVIGVPHEADGERPMGVIVLKPGATINEQDILEFFNSQVSDRKRLRAGVQFVTSLPYTPTGKIQRRILRQLYKDVAN